ncbi:hypothetical protein M3A88_10435 [Kocuria marina]|uniref:hypothetical protein n=1 Tax=Kocuria marina TaxID=223184 RepID=UPI002989A5BA|nr:hypothetical protein [Kocuria marina]MCT1735646.1 hypothetical protein [Kocuria marina]
MSTRPKIQKKKSTLAQERDKALREGHITPIRTAAAPAPAPDTQQQPAPTPAPVSAPAPADTSAATPQEQVGEGSGDATPRETKAESAPTPARRRRREQSPVSPKPTNGRGEPTQRMTLMMDSACVEAMEDLCYDELDATGIMPVKAKYYDRALADFLPPDRAAAKVMFEGDPVRVYTSLRASTRGKLRRIKGVRVGKKPVPESWFYTEAVRRFITKRRGELGLD